MFHVKPRESGELEMKNYKCEIEKKLSIISHL